MNFVKCIGINIDNIEFSIILNLDLVFTIVPLHENSIFEIYMNKEQIYPFKIKIKNEFNGKQIDNIEDLYNYWFQRSSVLID